MLLVVGNTGDDFEHLGLSISPDLDTIMYTWRDSITRCSVGVGATRPGRSWRRWAHSAARRGSGSAIVTSRCTSSARGGCARGKHYRRSPPISVRRLGIGPRLLPMSDDPVRTRVRTDEGWIDFQDYFVRRQCRPVVRALAFAGAEQAAANPQLLSALADPRCARS